MVIRDNRKTHIQKLSNKFNVPEDELQFRADGRVEWVCEHGVGHTVYAPEKMKESGYVHGCDGCCRKIFKDTQDFKG